MTSRRLSKYVAFAAFVGVLTLPTLAFAAEAAAADIGIGAGLKFIAAALVVGMSALGAGMAQGRIGSAGQGVLAERPEERIWVITLTALPEIIVLLGFVMGILVMNS
jgi:V/A-type H+-transporting ATPase subunit K